MNGDVHRVHVDLIFKNQALGQKRDASGHFVNDLLRTEFHKCVLVIIVLVLANVTLYSRKFMTKFIKVRVRSGRAVTATSCFLTVKHGSGVVW